MKRLLPIVWMVAFLCLACGRLAANSELRDWNFENGDTFHAQIQSVDEKAEKLVLRSEKGEERSLTFGDLSKLDRAWVLEWIEMNEEMAEKVKELGGRLERFEGKGVKHTTAFYVYHPSGEVKPEAPRPMMVLFDPSGNPVRYLLRHIEAAENAKMTLVSCEYFRNKRDFAEAFSRFEDVIAVIRPSVPHDANRLLLGGTSGGAWYAFAIAAQFPDIKISGVYTNGGWLGPSPQNDRPYPACRVAMVNGDKDVAVNNTVDDVSGILQKRGCTVSLFAFEGGHQIPPPSVQTKAFRWLIGEDP